MRVNEKMVSDKKILEIIDELDSHFKTSHGAYDTMICTLESSSTK